MPDLYDGLAWNAPVEFIGQFPTIPLHQREFPRGAFLIKRVLDVIAVGAGAGGALPVHAADCAADPDGLAGADLLPCGADWTQGPDVYLLEVPHHGGERGEDAGRPGAQE